MPSKIELSNCNVEYLRRSAKIAASLDLPGLEERIFDAPRQTFTPLGAYTFGSKELYVGIKKRLTTTYPNRYLEEIAIAETLLRSDATLRRSVPAFVIGVWAGETNLGILTEDFSKDGRHTVDEDKHRLPGIISHAGQLPTDFHRKIYAALRGNVYAEAFGHMSAIVEGEPKLIDFDEIAFTTHGTTREIRTTVEEYRDFATVRL